MEKGTTHSVKKIMFQKGWKKGFIKPIIGQSSRACLPFDADEEGIKQAQKHIDSLIKKEGLMMQPYLPNVKTIGEFSTICFNYEVSHTV
jgi:hypothetical protein